MMFKQINPQNFTRPLIYSLIIMMTAITFSCTNHNKQDILHLNICDTSITKYSTTISTIISNNCASQSGCHGPLPGSVSLEIYQNVKDRATDIVNRIKAGNMPKNNPKLDDCTILKIETWVNKGALNN